MRLSFKTDMIGAHSFQSRSNKWIEWVDQSDFSHDLFRLTKLPLFHSNHQGVVFCCPVFCLKMYLVVTLSVTRFPEAGLFHRTSVVRQRRRRRKPQEQSVLSQSSCSSVVEKSSAHVTSRGWLLSTSHLVSKEFPPTPWPNALLVLLKLGGSMSGR